MAVYLKKNNLYSFLGYQKNSCVSNMHVYRQRVVSLYCDGALQTMEMLRSLRHFHEMHRCQALRSTPMNTWADQTTEAMLVHSRTS